MVRATDNPLNPAYPANTLRSGIESRNITDASRPVAAACDILGEQLRFSTMSDATQALVGWYQGEPSEAMPRRGHYQVILADPPWSGVAIRMRVKGAGDTP